MDIVNVVLIARRHGPDVAPSLGKSCSHNVIVDYGRKTGGSTTPTRYLRFHGLRWTFASTRKRTNGRPRTDRAGSANESPRAVADHQLSGG